MAESETFELFSERMFEPRDVGKLVLVEHFKLLIERTGQWEATTYSGVLTGFTEKFGEREFGPTRPAPDALDTSLFPNYKLILSFQHWGQVWIDAKDRANVTVYGRSPRPLRLVET